MKQVTLADFATTLCQTNRKGENDKCISLYILALMLHIILSSQ